MSKLDIRRALAEHGITQATLCERTGLRTQNIISLINGNPTVLKLQQVAEGILQICSIQKREPQICQSMTLAMKQQ